jgi:hypothetical protein
MHRINPLLDEANVPHSKLWARAVVNGDHEAVISLFLSFLPCLRSFSLEEAFIGNPQHLEHDARVGYQGGRWESHNAPATIRPGHKLQLLKRARPRSGTRMHKKSTMISLLSSVVKPPSAVQSLDSPPLALSLPRNIKHLVINEGHLRGEDGL